MQYSITNYFTQKHKFYNINNHQALIVKASLEITFKKLKTSDRSRFFQLRFLLSKMIMSSLQFITYFFFTFGYFPDKKTKTFDQYVMQKEGYYENKKKESGN